MMPSCHAPVCGGWTQWAHGSAIAASKTIHVQTHLSFTYVLNMMVAELHPCNGAPRRWRLPMRRFQSICHRAMDALPASPGTHRRSGVDVPDPRRPEEQARVQQWERRRTPVECVHTGEHHSHRKLACILNCLMSRPQGSATAGVAHEPPHADPNGCGEMGHDHREACNLEITKSADA